MRRIVIMLAGASLWACGQTAEAPAEDDVSATAQRAALSFDGADYGDDQALMLAHGERLSHVLGCRGCHTADLTGMPFPPEEEGFPASGIWAPNLTRSLQTMDDAALRKLLVAGVHPTRDKMWMMPSDIFQDLSDADVDALIAHLRTVEPTGEPSPLPNPSPAFMELVEKGIERPIADRMADHRNNPPADLGRDHALGRHIARSTCAECHGPNLAGVPDFTPDLSSVAPMYDEAAFTRLLTTGESYNGRDIGLMGLVGKEHFSYLTDGERTALVRYLKTLADKAATEQQ